MKHIRDQGWKNVGVVDFRFHREGQKVTFHAGAINDNMASRLENALILANNPETPVGIIHNAGKVAGSKLKNANYRTAPARQQLFGIQYPLAWGTKPQMVTPDAILTGHVTLSKDLKTTSVVVEAFEQKAADKISKLAEFSVKTDRYILADCGQGFVLSRKVKFRRDMDINDIVVDGASSNDAGGQTTGGSTTGQTAGGAPPTELVTIRIYYAGSEQSATRDSLGGNTWVIGDGKGPAVGQEVLFKVQNMTTEKLGLVLIVNNKNSLYEETYTSDSNPEGMTRWILEPNKEYSIKGWYQSDNVSHKKFTGGNPPAVEDLGGDELAGKVHVFVFKNGGDVTDSGLTFGRNLRSLPASLLKKTGPPSTITDLQKMIAQNGLRRAGRAFILPGETATNVALQEDALSNPARVEHRVYEYFQRQYWEQPTVP
jgi:hypothetical protein